MGKLVKEEQVKDYRAVRFGKAIKEKRKKIGLTQADLARVSGLTQPVIARLEVGGVRNPQAKTFVALSKALDTDIDELKSYFDAKTSRFDMKNSASCTDVYVSIPKAAVASLKGNPELLKAKVYSYVDKIKDNDMPLLLYFIQGMYSNYGKKEMEEVMRSQQKDNEVGIDASRINLDTIEEMYSQGSKWFNKWVASQRKLLACSPNDLSMFNYYVDVFLRINEEEDSNNNLS